MEQPIALTAIASYVPSGRVTAGRATGLSGVDANVAPRPVAGHDEDTVTMAAEALRRLPEVGPEPARLVFATTHLPYEGKTNAAFVAAAAAIPASSPAWDLAGGSAAAVAAIEQCRAGGGLVTVADLVVDRPGSAHEGLGADAAVAVRLAPQGTEPAIATIDNVAIRASTDLLHWRLPGEVVDRSWRGRYAAHAQRAAALELARDLTSEAPADVVAVSSSDRRLAGAVARELGGRAVVDAGDGVGHAGMADAGLVLEAALHRSTAGETMLLLVLGDGVAGVLLTRGEATPVGPVRSASREVAYTEYLSWRGLLGRDTAGRPDPDAPSVPAVARQADWKYGLVASACRRCRTVVVPPARVCLTCGAVDEMAEHPLVGREGTIATWTADHLAWGISKPVCSAIVDFDGGGRLECEVADAQPARLAVGGRVRMTLRRSHTSDGIHNYVWKAVLVDEVAT